MKSGSKGFPCMQRNIGSKMSQSCASSSEMSSKICGCGEILLLLKNVMEFETFGYCYLLVFGMVIELVAVISFLLLLSGLVFHYCNISTYYFP